jgi:hypothetical protein
MTTAVRKKRVLKPYLPNVRPGAQYVSDGGQEYTIEQNPKTGLYFIKRYNGGVLPKAIQGFHTSRRAAESLLIGWLITDDKLNRAIWPGKVGGRKNFVKTVGK